MWAHLIFVNLFALVVAASVAGAVLPYRARTIRNARIEKRDAAKERRFPWFWVAFPLTCFSVATALSVSLDPPLLLRGSRRYADYLEPDAFTIANVLTTVFIAVAVISAAVSIWAWLTRRI